MRTVKLVLIAVLVSVSMMSYSTNEEQEYRAGENIALEVAMQNSDLLGVMFGQINENLIEGEQRGNYVARVVYKGKTLLIHGDLKTWEAYFVQSKWVGLDGGGGNMPIKIDRYTY